MSFTEVAESHESGHIFSDLIAGIDRFTDNLKIFSSPSYIDAFSYIYLEEGKMQLSINGKVYDLSSNDLVILSPIHLIEFKEIECDAKYKILFIDKTFLDEIPYNEKNYKLVLLYNSPVVSMNNSDGIIISECINSVLNKIKMNNHLLQKEMIQVFITNFLLELTNILIRRKTHDLLISRQRHDEVFRKFAELIIEHYKSEHKVTFYAQKLNMTPQNLTLIIKKVTGETVNSFINEMLRSEARRLLCQPKISIQEIAEILHFSDQSSFGKFFKRLALISPIEFRNIHLKK